MVVLDLHQIIDHLAMANSVPWGSTLQFEVEGQGRKGVQEGRGGERGGGVMCVEDVLCWSNGIVGVNRIAAGLMWIWPPPFIGLTVQFKTTVFLLYLGKVVCTEHTHNITLPTTTVLLCVCVLLLLCVCVFNCDCVCFVVCVCVCV